MRRTISLLPILMLALLTHFAVAASEPERAPAWALKQHHVTSASPMSGLFSPSVWDSDGWPGGKAEIVGGGKLVRLQTVVDAAESPWAHFNATFSEPRDWSAFDGIRLTVRASCSERSRPVTVRIVLNEEEQMKLNGVPMPYGSERTLLLPFPAEKRGMLRDVRRLRFYLVSREFPDGARIWMQAGDFQLVKLREQRAGLPRGEAGLEMFFGDAGEVNILEEGRHPQARVRVHTGPGCSLRASEKLTLRLTHMFSGKDSVLTVPLGRGVAAGSVAEIPCDLGAPPPGYYWVKADIRRGGKSVAGGRVGFADFYVRRTGDSMVKAMLDIRTGMGRYIIDPAGAYGSGSVKLMPTYDPRDEARYLDFIRAYREWTPRGASTSKDTEVLEAGITGTVFAAYAYRAVGDEDGRRFAEWLIKNNCDYMRDHMQNPDGSTRWDVNVFYMRNLGHYGDQVDDWRVPDTNQIGEWLRAISRAILYFRDDPSQREYADRLYRAALKSGDYLARVSTERVGRHANVIRHFRLLDGKYPGGRRWLYQQEERECDVYAPRAMAGLSYFAYVRQLREGRVPQSYLDALKDTTAWALEKMQPETGWFDWQCGYDVEGGCHSFLGNQYLAEAAQGYYLLCAERGDRQEAQQAAECARRALLFITDDCRGFHGYRGDTPQEFWVGPYLYWQFSEYLGSIGEEKPFRDYLRYLHRGWAEVRGWRDFTQRTGEGPVFRSNTLEHITMSILAYPALRLLEERGAPFRYNVPTRDQLGR